MVEYKLQGIGPPYKKQQEIISYIMTPEHDRAKPVDVMCGLGFGKSSLAFDLAIRVLGIPGQKILFLEPDRKRMENVFLSNWKSIVPKQLYSINEGKRRIIWNPTGSILLYDHRDIRGNKASRERRFQGINLTGVIDDETAEKFLLSQYAYTFNRIRTKSPVRFYLTISTPIVNEYSLLIQSEHHKLFTGTTFDNPYLEENYIRDMMKNMSPKQIRREIYGELISLEGRIWSDWDDSLNVSRHKFTPSKPYCLAGDIGVCSAWLVVQRFGQDDVIVGQVLRDDGGTRQDIAEIVQRFGPPVKIITGSDLNSRSQVSGTTAAFEIGQALEAAGCSSRIPIITPAMLDFSYTDKGIQLGNMQSLIERHILKLSDQCKIIGNEQRSFIAMVNQDEYPDMGSVQKWFNKDKKSGKESPIEDVRDASLYYCVCEHPPTIRNAR